MKVVLLSGASSPHTTQWANGLQAAGVEVHIISQHPLVEPLTAGIKVHLFPYRGVLGYFTMVPGVKKLLNKINPDVINAHRASGYGTTARLVGRRPWILSVWGGDVYDFPYKTVLHKRLIQKNLRAADAVASTSRCMAVQTQTLTPELREIAITPFGVDMASYSVFPDATASIDGRDGECVIGTVKTMASTYGVDTLIKAFALARTRLKEDDPDLAARLQLLLVGGGPQTEELKILSINEGIAEVTTFTGQVSHAQVPDKLAELDIYVALSRSESFGVAIIEAGAAGRPVIVSDAGGLAEVTLDGETGIVVPRENPEAACEAILRLVRDPELRSRMGAAGQRHVAEHYSWPACIATMQRLYQAVIDQSGKK